MSEPGMPDINYWRGEGGDHWTRFQKFTEHMFSPIFQPLLDAAAAKPGEAVIDIGCGCGQTSIALAERVGPTGRILGVDVSAEMLEVAKKRAPAGAKVEFAVADAAEHAFPKAAFDLLFSRHGVMFFDDPVRAFSNLRSALKPTGRLVFSCFRGPSMNPWAMVPLKAAQPLLPPLPKPDPESPSAFAFAEPMRVLRILQGAGFKDVAMKPVDLAFELSAGDGLDGAVGHIIDIGPTSRAIQSQPPEQAAKIKTALRDAVRPYFKNNELKLGVGIWLVNARNS